jgi:hypothetical protein
MTNSKAFFISFIFLIFPFCAIAQPGCIRVDQIAKWEVLDVTKTIVYDSQGNSIAFVIFDPGFNGYLKKSNETFRFFSPTICRNDRVQISSAMVTISSIEPIRK